MAAIDRDPAIAICFAVAIDGHDIGTFTKCDGLGLEVEVERREEGGNNEYVHQLPKRITYTNVKLTRTFGPDSEKLARWFGRMTSGADRTTAEIRALGPDGSTIATWSLNGVMPVRWSGPSFEAGSTQVATETLELAHHGFM